MINLITGTPGSGKTAYSLDFMLKTVKEGRQLYVHGIPDLKIPHIIAYCDSKACDVCTFYTDEEKNQKMVPANEWHLFAPDGSVFFFDESQNIYRPRSSGSKVPDNVAAFEVHRHKGLDFFLITQSPRLIDSNIRSLVSRHIHLRVNWRGRKQFEWPECKDNPQSTSDAIASTYVLNSKIFPLYKSATVHTKQQRKIPLVVFFLGFLILFASGLSFYIFNVFSEKFNPEPTLQAAPAGNSSEFPAARPLPTTTVSQPKTTIESRFDFRPTIAGVLESAPAYSPIVVVKNFPRISACLSQGSKCTCYTQQGTVYPTTPDRCNAFINSDIQAFDPYYQPEPVQTVSTKTDT